MMAGRAGMKCPRLLNPRFFASPGMTECLNTRAGFKPAVLLCHCQLNTNSLSFQIVKRFFKPLKPLEKRFYREHRF